jgi:hypothetical protein
MNFNKKLDKIIDKTPPLVISMFTILVLLLLPFTILVMEIGWKTIYVIVATFMMIVVMKFAFWVNKKMNLIKIEVN